MAKLKAPTPQELYRARKQREEQEKTALLPPGLFNHGNTCFMNSVLQGLIATRLLADLGTFRPISPVVQIHSITPLLSHRSPLLTNGHGIGGPAEQPWVNTMPIGDIFLEIMHRAWDVQSERRRGNLSPKPLLGALGQKYDQYLDFAQQDAHEFLRILLDAMRMEEFDIIKKRQPPAEHPTKRRRTTITPASVRSSDNVQEPLAPPSIPDDEKLMSLSDMIFGGKLTSILVCQKCKHVSQTFEDFNDISLSLKAEDYRVRKRDRLKNLAKRLASFPTASPANTLTVGSDIPRPSSVPPSPSIRDGKQFIGHDEPPIADDPRRRSLDVVATVGDELDGTYTSSSITAKEDQVLLESGRDDVPSNHVVKQRRIEILDPVKEKKEKKDDGWSKIGRRISMSVGLTKGSKDRMSRSKNRNSFDMSRPATSLGVPHSQESKERRFVGDAVSPKSTSEPRISETFQDSAPVILMSRPSAPSPTTKDHDAKSGSREPSPSRHGIARLPTLRGRSPKPPQPSMAETEYLRKILADVTPASSTNPFDILKPAFHQSGNQRAVSTGSAQNLWLSMSQFSGIEECLRLFTAVEVLDGENMVGCRRCWKIANGVYPLKQQDEQEIADDDSDSVEHDSPVTPLPTTWEERKPRQTLPLLSPTVAHVPASMSTPTVSFYAQSNGSDYRSVSSLPTNTTLAESDIEPTPTSSSLASTEDLHGDNQRPITPGDLPIPAISTTGPDSPIADAQSSNASSSSSPLRQSPFPSSEPDLTNCTSSPTPDLDETSISYPTPRIAQLVAHHPPTTSGVSLVVPKRRHGLHKPEVENIDESSSAESETSVATSVDTSTSPDQSQDVVNEAKPSSHPVVKKPSRPKPVIMRPAYKRYLIGTPPPVLVIHLKRFQQMSKTHMVSFSYGFKKLDDYVTFPEHLDLTPYLAPKKEDFGLGKKGKVRPHIKRRKTDDKCMYRLYAVVVHIGNMLGGHYIAYTALPNPPSQEDEKISKPTSSASDRKSGNKAASEGTKPERQWAYISDTIVRLTTLEEVLKAKAYICMYERI